MHFTSNSTFPPLLKVLMYLLTSLLISFSIFAQEVQLDFGKDLSISKTRTSLILEEIKQEISFNNFNPNQRKYIFNLLQQINKNTTYATKTEIHELFMSELFKLILSSPFIQDTKVQISPAIISSSQQNLNTNAKSYSPLAKFLISEFIKDFAPYLEDGSLHKYYKNKLLSQPRVIQVKSLLKYSAGWIVKFNSLNPKKFNQLVLSHLFIYLSNLGKKSHIFLNHSRLKRKKYNSIFQFNNLQGYRNLFSSNKSKP